MINLPGYTLHDRLHEGARTVLYRGQRLADEADVVVKFLKGDDPSPRDVGNLRHEHAVLHELSVPGVVKAYALEWRSCEGRRA